MAELNTEVVTKLRELQQEFNDRAVELSRQNPVKVFFKGQFGKAASLRADAEKVGKALAEYQSDDPFERLFSKTRLQFHQCSFNAVADIFGDIGKSPARFVLGKYKSDVEEARKYAGKLGGIIALM